MGWPNPFAYPYPVYSAQLLIAKLDKMKSSNVLTLYTPCTSLDLPTTNKGTQMAKFTAIIIRAEDQLVEFAEFDNNEVKPMQDAVGGYLQALTVSTPCGDITFWVNEEGKLLHLPINDAATNLWWFFAPEFTNRDVLVGDAIITGGADGNGDTLGVPKVLENAFKDAIIGVVIKDKG
ncbi:Domain of uncharacterised function (DUF3846) [Mycobacteroides abscessus subsp. abscessus]|nr:Domain of uncharacterised function (DUF3846) [Mycobacteroides abscessus subsp. abscessus]